jgi:GT2 family glycosyltransferase
LKPISFVIITYNRPADMLALARNICTLERAGELLDEVLIVNNASTEDYGAVKDFIRTVQDIRFHYIDAPSNLGVARGRNYGIGFVKAPYLIMLDDDAEMGNRDCLVNLVKEFNTPDEDRRPAIISFKVLYYDTMEMQVNCFPQKNFNKYKDMHRFRACYYAGGAHAIRREAFIQAGKYPEDFFYGMEEYDLGYRIIDAGFSIVYSDRIVMLHKESPHGRTTKKEKLQMLWVNKSKVAWRYLPFRFFLSTSLMWSLEYLRKSGFDLAGWLHGWYKVLGISGGEHRKPISAASLDYLRENEARLWY